MDSKGAVKRELRRAFVGGPLCAKEAATEECPVERIRAAWDPEIEKHLRVFELREIVGPMLAQDPEAALAAIAGMLGLHNHGLFIGVAPKATEADAPMTEAVEAVAAVAQAHLATHAALADGVADPSEQADLSNRWRAAQRECAEAIVAVRAQPTMPLLPGVCRHA